MCQKLRDVCLFRWYKGKILMCVPSKTCSDVTAHVGSAMGLRVHWGKYVSPFRNENWSGGDRQY